jgi:hypothetical protein
VPRTNAHEIASEKTARSWCGWSGRGGVEVSPAMTAYADPRLQPHCKAAMTIPYQGRRPVPLMAPAWPGPQGPVFPAIGSGRRLRPEQTLAGGRIIIRVFIAGSTDGLGRAAARVLLDEGHQVVLRAVPERGRRRSPASPRGPRGSSSETSAAQPTPGCSPIRSMTSAGWTRSSTTRGSTSSVPAARRQRATRGPWP